jgi:hypothetical protein
MTRSAILIRRFALICLVLAALFVPLGCSETSDNAGGLMLIVTSDMPVPKDIDTVRIEIVRGTENLYKVDFKLGTGPGDHQLPATLAVLPGSDPSSAVTIRVIGMQGPRARTLREAITTIPTDRVAALRMPIEFFCDGKVKQTPPDNIDTTCPNQQTCSEGICVDAHVDSSMLPGYTAGDELREAGTSDAGAPVDGRADADATAAPESSTGSDASDATVIPDRSTTSDAGPDVATEADAGVASDGGSDTSSRDVTIDQTTGSDAADATSEARTEAGTDASADVTASDVAASDASGDARVDASLDAANDVAEAGGGGPCTSANFALSTSGATATAQTTYGGYNATNVIDGDRSTVQIESSSWTNDWNPPTVILPQWFQIDFGGTKTFSRVDVYTSQGYPIQDYDLQYWNGTAWVDILQERGNVQLHVTHQLAPVTGSKLQIIARQGPSGQPNFTRLNEVEVCRN